eukprot:TRINITY_DN45408_c0_g1_i1.p1 TRINITY_DN45408_c0_g1~~TRINITY_DN45408_c0_g1_i1.p1  ORF type:complete len:456 (+),score=62.19 TRINITY_DN45408_c0_g1_i1:77-1444(+)
MGDSEDIKALEDEADDDASQSDDGSEAAEDNADDSKAGGGGGGSLPHDCKVILIRGIQAKTSQKDLAALLRKWGFGDHNYIYVPERRKKDKVDRKTGFAFIGFPTPARTRAFAERVVEHQFPGPGSPTVQVAAAHINGAVDHKAKRQQQQNQSQKRDGDRRGEPSAKRRTPSLPWNVPFTEFELRSMDAKGSTRPCWLLDDDDRRGYYPPAPHPAAHGAHYAQPAPLHAHYHAPSASPPQHHPGYSAPVPQPQPHAPAAHAVVHQPPPTPAAHPSHGLATTAPQLQHQLQPFGVAPGAPPNPSHPTPQFALPEADGPPGQLHAPPPQPAPAPVSYAVESVPPGQHAHYPASSSSAPAPGHTGQASAPASMGTGPQPGHYNTHYTHPQGNAAPPHHVHAPSPPQQHQQHPPQHAANPHFHAHSPLQQHHQHIPQISPGHTPHAHPGAPAPYATAFR